MRRRLLTIVPIVSAFGLVAGCKDISSEPGFRKTLPPPPLDLVVATGAVATPGGVDLLVSAVIRNTRSAAVAILTGPTCAPFVSLFANPTGASIGHLDGSMECPKGSPSVVLPPGDTIRLVHRLSAGELAAFVPGKYGVDVAITASTEVFGRSAGNIDLPLTVAGAHLASQLRNARFGRAGLLTRVATGGRSKHGG